MLNRNTVVLVAGAAIFTLASSAASAQDSTRTRPRSQRRIPVTKEAPGEVTPPRVDTVTVYHTDTLRTERVDTVTNTRTVTVHDTVTNTVMVRPPMFGGMYLGLAGGTNLPYGSIRSVNNPAATAQLQVGWQPLDRVFGLRADAEYNQFSHTADYAFLGSRPNVWNVNADVRFDVPIFKNFLGGAGRFVPYLLGGGSFIAYNNLRGRLDEGSANVGFPPLNATLIGGDDSYHHNFGWNAGGGLAVHFGRKELFVESRVISFNRGTDNNGANFSSARQIPIVFGINFY